jgi:hypothetical protein
LVKPRARLRGALGEKQTQANHKPLRKWERPFPDLPASNLPVKTFYLGLCTIAIAVASVVLATELLLRFFWQEEPYYWDRRLMFFSEGKVFQNRDWGGFVYHPNATIRSQTFYIVDEATGEIVKEYDYLIKTNSLGLVQLKNVDPSKPSIILLGDSFTEGQGASPWFYELESRWPDTAFHQIINGGILGTGVEAWGRLYRDVASRVKIDKAVFIFISHDWNRSVWQFPKKVLDCLMSHSYCTGEEGFYGVSEDPASAEAYIAKIAKARIDRAANATAGKTALKRSAIFKKLIRPAYYRLRQSIQGKKTKIAAANRQFEISRKTVRDVVGQLGEENVLFLHLPTKWEIGSGPNDLGKKAREFISGENLRFVDGFRSCGLTAADYHIDGHPDDSGYKKITDCVERAIKTAFHPL